MTRVLLLLVVPLAALTFAVYAAQPWLDDFQARLDDTEQP